MKSTFRIAVVSFSAAGVLFLSSCSSDNAQQSTDDSGGSGGENSEVCTEFAFAYDELRSILTSPPSDASGLEAWRADSVAAAGKFGALGDKSSGDVNAALSALVEALPADPLELLEADSASGQAFVDNSSAVASACEAEGTTLTLDEFPLLKF